MSGVCVASESVVDLENVLLNLKCEARSLLMGLRATFRQDINKLIGEVPWIIDLLEQVIDLLHDQRLTDEVTILLVLDYH